MGVSRRIWIALALFFWVAVALARGEQVSGESLDPPAPDGDATAATPVDVAAATATNATEGGVEEEEADGRHAYFRAMEALREQQQEAEEAASEEEEEVEEPFNCTVYLGPSTWIHGIGIIAGKDFGPDEPIDYGIGVPVPNNLKKAFWQLDNYAFASDEAGWSLAMIGITMLFNHQNPANTAYYYDTDDGKAVADSLDRPYTTHHPIYHLAGNTTHIKRGEEIFTKYSESDNWFRDRGIPVVTNEELLSKAAQTNTTGTVSQQELDEHYHCMTNVAIADSDLPYAGQGIFAARRFAEDETVTISPVLALPRFNIGSLGEASLLQNYCIAEMLSEVCLLPIGHAGVANHGASPNAQMEWHQWPTGDPNQLRDQLALNVTDLLHAPFSQLYLAYRALRPIQTGEEILISYGPHWLDDWTTYLSHFLQYLETKIALAEADDEEDQEEPRFPLFRSFIAPPPGLFPAHWQMDAALFEEHLEEVSALRKQAQGQSQGQGQGQGHGQGQGEGEEDGSDLYYDEEDEGEGEGEGEGGEEGSEELMSEEL